MKTAKDRPYSDLAQPLNGPMERRIFGERKVGSNVIVIGRIRRKDSAQMAFAKDDNVIEAFPSNRADQPLRMSILPG